MMRKHMIQSAPKTILAALGFFALAACQTSGSAHQYDTVKRTSIELVRLPFEIKPEADGTDTLSANTTYNLQAFLSSVNAGYGDIIMLDAPTANAARIEAITAFLKAKGLAFGGVVPLGQQPSGKAVMLYVERYHATVPNCGQWPAHSVDVNRNNHMPFHGCATASTLAQMVANPRDLVAGQSGKGAAGAGVSAIQGLNTPATTPAPTITLPLTVPSNNSTNRK